MSDLVFKVKTDNTGTSANDQFTLDMQSSAETIDISWGDGSSDDIGVSNDITHTFLGGAGTYTVTISNPSGPKQPIRFNGGGDRLKLIEITTWGDQLTWSRMDNAFYGCSNMVITAADIPDTTGATQMSQVFRNCSLITTIPAFDTSLATSLSSICEGCTSLTSFPAIDTGSSTQFTSSWDACSSLTTFPLLDFSSATTLYSTWLGCSGLTSFPAIDTSSVGAMSQTWSGCSGLTSFPALNLSTCTNFTLAWNGCSGLTSFPSIDTSSGTLFSSTWFGCSNLTSFPTLDVGLGTSFNSAWEGCANLTSFPALDFSSATSFTTCWFFCTGLTSFPFINTGSVTSFSNAWGNCTGLNGFDFPLIDLSSMTTGSSMFNAVTLSTSSWSALLIDVEANNVNTGVTWSGGNSLHTPAGAAAKTALESRAPAWTVTDGGPAPNTPPSGTYNSITQR